MKEKLKFVKDFIKNSPVNALFLEKGRRIAAINKSALSNLKLIKSAVIGLNLDEFIDNFFERKGEHLLKRNDRLYRASEFPVRLNSENTGIAFILTDITEEQRIKYEFENESILTNQIIESLPDMLFVIDKEGKVIVWNKAAEEMTGVKKEEILGKGNYEYAIPIYGKRRPLLIDYALRNTLPKKGVYSELEKHGKTITGFTDKPILKGKNKILWGKAAPLFDKKGNLIGAVEVIRDITKMKKMEERLRYFAERDPLTGVFNRRQLAILLEREIERSKRTNTPLTIFYIDIDNMKEINDNFGHAEGDKLLKTIASVFTEGVRKIDIVARIGGDEFVIVLPSAKGKDAVRLIERLRKKLRERLKNKPYDVDFSYGAYEFNPLTPISVEKMLTESDTRMYKMKKSKKQKAK